MRKIFALASAVICILASVAHAEPLAPQSGFYSGTGFVNVYGKLESFEKGDDVSILLLDENEKVKYIREADVSSTGEYRFTFKFSGDATDYTLKARQGSEDVTSSVIQAVAKSDAVSLVLDTTPDELNTIYSANVQNWYNVENKEYSVITAHYDNTGKLLQMKCDEPRTLRFGENISEHSVEIPENSDMVKVFVWESLTTAIPLSKAAEVLPEENNITSLSIQVGEDETSRRFVWYNDIDTAGVRLQYALKSDYDADGGFTDENSKVVSGRSEIPYKNTEFVSCKAEIYDLTLGETYIYRVGDRYSYDDSTYTFNTYDNLDKKQSFGIVSDIHINRKNYETASPESVQNQVNRWQNVMAKMQEVSPELGFIVSTGDNISIHNMYSLTDEETAKIAEKEHETLFAPALSKSIPFASTMGNHEITWAWDNIKFDWGHSNVTGYHYNLPNDDGESGMVLDKSMANFYFISGDVLVIGINDMAGKTFGAFQNLTTEKNKAYIQKACEANPNARWKILVTHIPPYAFYASDDETKHMRDVFDDYCDEFNIDVVFTGHSHLFARSKHIKGNAVTKDIVTSVKNDKGYQTAEVTDPTGTVYYNVPSALGHAFAGADADYKTWLNAWGSTTGAANQTEDFGEGVKYDSPMFINVDTDSTGTTPKMVIKTMRSDNLEAIDTYTIYKNDK